MTYLEIGVRWTNVLKFCMMISTIIPLEQVYGIFINYLWVSGSFYSNFASKAVELCILKSIHQTFS